MQTNQFIKSLLSILKNIGIFIVSILAFLLIILIDAGRMYILIAFLAFSALYYIFIFLSFCVHFVTTIIKYTYIRAKIRKHDKYLKHANHLIKQ